MSLPFHTWVKSDTLLERWYYWKHLSTNTIGKSRIYVISDQDLQSLIDYWNTIRPKEWVYSLTLLERS